VKTATDQSNTITIEEDDGLLHGTQVETKGFHLGVTLTKKFSMIHILLQWQQQKN
jgi:hypothetical protein